MLALALATGGCQSYEAHPLELSAHQDAFLARALDGPEVAQFAASLAQSVPPAPGGFDLADGVSLAEAEAVAMVFNADLRMARLRAGVTEAGAANAGLWEDPTIGVDITRIIENVRDPWKLAATIGITFPVSGRLEVEKSKAGKEHAAALARIVEDEWNTRIRLRAAWASWTALLAQIETAKEFLGRVDQVLAIVDAMEQQGEIPRTEARLFRVEKATKANDLRVLEADLAEGELTIKQLMGLSPVAPISLTRGDFAPPSGDPGPGARPLYETNASIAAARAAYDVAEDALRLEVRKQYPDITLGPGYGLDDGNNEVLLGISLPLPVLNANRRGIAEAHAAREVARGNVETLLERLVSDVARADVQLKATAAQRRALETEIVPLVDTQYAEAREIARRGEVNSLLMLETLTRQHETKVRLIDAVRNESLARIRRDELTGPPWIPALSVTGSAASPPALEGGHP